MSVQALSSDVLPEIGTFDLQAGVKVDVLAYGGSEPLASIVSNSNIHIYTIPDPYAWP